jgi:hypothetical protein
MRSHVGRELVQDLTDFFHAMPADTLPSLPLPLDLAPPLASELPI